MFARQPDLDEMSNTTTVSYIFETVIPNVLTFLHTHICAMFEL